jgi:hypothetical protein
MANSGAVADALFADGFLGALRASSAVCGYADSQWRPVARLSPPYGSIIGDVAVTFRRPADQRDVLLIVEREGSAPGNERNILKWVEARRCGAPIVLTQLANHTAVSVQEIQLVLAFGRPAGWPPSDFAKAVAFCRLLTDMANAQRSASAIPMHVTVLNPTLVAVDWQRHGREVAQLVLEQIIVP